MPALDYQNGGIYWDSVQNVMTACSCSRLRAVSALKASGNDEAEAIASMRDMHHLHGYNKSAVSTSPPPSSQVPRPDSRSSHPSVDDLPPQYAEHPTTPVQAPPPKPVDPMEEWDLNLPEVTIDPAEDEFVIEDGRSMPFSPRRLLTILQHGMKRAQLQHYLSFYTAPAVQAWVNAPVEGFPPIFYVAATNDEELLRIWVESGASPSAVDELRRMPVLAFVLMRGSLPGVNTTKVAVTLISLGAEVSSIPRIFFMPYVDDPIDKVGSFPKISEFKEPKKSWCLPWMRDVLATTVDLTQRYFLYKAGTEKSHSDRQVQVAEIHQAKSLLRVPFYLIGQTSAIRAVIQKLLAHMAMPRSKPLVMVFAGPSGHGKTELARQLGQLLSVEIECVDCTEMKYESDLFGPKKPYMGYAKGSPTNNFLSRTAGRRCIVFLDEFEKTSKEVQNSLLIPFDEGRYLDRRNQNPIDCSQTIWVIATNALDNIILDHCKVHREDLLESENPLQQQQSAAVLSGLLKRQLKTEFGNPLSGRITAVIPFLPFTPNEAAVVAHKYILGLQDKVRRNVKVSSQAGAAATGRQLVGGITLHVRNDGAICTAIASEGYDPDQGARSLQAAVQSRIGDELVQSYLEEEGLIQDGQPLIEYTVEMARNGVLSVLKKSW